MAEDYRTYCSGCGVVVRDDQEFCPECQVDFNEPAFSSVKYSKTEREAFSAKGILNRVFEIHDQMKAGTYKPIETLAALYCQTCGRVVGSCGH